MKIAYEYGTAPGAYAARTAPQAAAAGAPLETLIDGLQPDTRYYYRIRYGDAAGQERAFVTQRAPGSAFTFTIQGDSHPERAGKQFDAALYTRTLLSAAASRPDFHMTIGDDFSVDALKSVDAGIVRSLYVRQRQWLGLVGAPVFLVNGNHEQAALANLDGTPDNVAVWAQTARNAYYPQPTPDGFYTGDGVPVEHIGLLRDYYAFTWGDALFVVIDPYWHSSQAVDNQFGADREQKKKRDLWNATLGNAQYRWFRQMLETSPARYKFVFAHHVNGTGRGGVELAGAYEWGDAANLAAHRPGWDKTIHQLMADNGVTIFFQGHDHLFARQELDGVIYQTLPEPANPNYTIENDDAFESGDKLPNSGHVRVAVSPEKVVVDYIRSYLDRPDELAFTYRISSTPQAFSSARPAPAADSPPTPTPVPAAPEQARQLRRAPRAVETPSNNRGSDVAQDLPLDVPAHPLSVILGRPTQRSIVVSVLASRDFEGYIEYGASPGTASLMTPLRAFSANQPAEVLIDALQADTPYAYRVRYRAGSAGEFAGTETGTFHTQRAPGNPFTFTVQADSHLDSNSDLRVYEQTLMNERADQPDFVIDLGDTFMTDKHQPYTNARAQYLAQRYYLGLIGQSAPVFLALGNHDGEGAPHGGAANGMSSWSASMRTLHFPNPVPGDFYTGNATPQESIGLLQDYYAWEWGSALFVVLDPYWFTPARRGAADLWNTTLGDAQYQWLKTTLETSRARWKFVFIHQLVGGLDQNGRGGVEAAGLYEWGGNNADGTWGFDQQRPGWAMPIHQLLAANGVTAVFHGHDHLFARQDRDGIIYQAVPQPSAAHSGSANSAAEYGYAKGDILGGSGHLRMMVAPDQVTVEYIRAGLPNGQVGSRYALTASP
jgi:phosphodiesterase/alkaline phosphatase D-like protein